MDHVEVVAKPEYHRPAWVVIAMTGAPTALVLIVLLTQDVRAWFFSGPNLRVAYLLLFSFGTAYLATPIAGVIAQWTGVMDYPAQRKMHQAPTPLLGGLAIYTAFAMTIFVNNLYTVELKSVAIAATLVFCIGLLDDIRPLSAWSRLGVQLLGVGIMIGYGVRVSFMPPSWWGDTLEVVFTVIWVIGITNAINLIDGLDGLASGSVMINAAFFSLIAVQTSQPYMRFLSIALAGSCLGFLPYNLRPRRPASIFLGDGGSNFIGFTIAALGVLGDWGTNSSVDLITPILILGVPIFDMTLTTILRIKDGRVRSLSQWLHCTGKDHFHHRLVEIGLSPRLAVFTIFLISVTLGISAAVLRRAEGIDALLLLGQAILMFSMIGYFMVFVKQQYRL
ncbi:MAG: undecaprenyl/decaprenyl-phosphate alpha-N-acetylglucosaminyl 1-phosphate transferase [Candidatus Latescibacteria bacterium]|nr:undecaprenyl/decaprenyl-phosphate alpha-N-acetylglucosaminyl 1-phosphate transferase [Candidatus Latescibacterota bacterium]